MKQKKELIISICFIVTVVVCMPAIGLARNAIPSDRQSTLSTHMNTEVLNDKEQFLEKREEVKFVAGLIKGFLGDNNVKFFDVGCGDNSFLNAILETFPEGNDKGVKIEFACGVDNDGGKTSKHTTDPRFLFIHSSIAELLKMFEDDTVDIAKGVHREGHEVVQQNMEKIQNNFNVITVNGIMPSFLSLLPSLVHALGTEREIVILRTYYPDWARGTSHLMQKCQTFVDRGFNLEIFGDANHVGKDLDELSRELYQKFPNNFHNRFMRGYPSTKWGTDSFFIVLTREKKPHPNNQDMPEKVMSAWSILSYQAA